MSSSASRQVLFLEKSLSKRRKKDKKRERKKDQQSFFGIEILNSQGLSNLCDTVNAFADGELVCASPMTW